MRPRLLRAAIVLTFGLLAALTANRMRPRQPKFDAAAFRAQYEAAFRNRDIGFYEELFSSDFWLGRQFPTRAAALAYLRDLFAGYAKTDALLYVDGVRRIAGGRALSMDASLILTGGRTDDQEAQEIADTVGSSFFVFERGRWRIYKNIERSAPQLAEQ